MELIIDEEFKRLLPILKDDEKAKLEEDIKQNGVIYPLITWKHLLIDGHNRYEICKANNIPFKTMEVNFTDRDDAKVWILEHQLGRRNLSDVERVEVAMKYEDVISKKGKKRMADGGRLKVGSTDPTFNTNDELGKIAGVSGSSVKRIKNVLRHGTPEQIERLHRGGHEPDGRSNSITAIADEVKHDGKTFKCYNCGKLLPSSAFYFKKNGQCTYECKECSKVRRKPKKYKDIKGNTIKSADISMTEEELKDYLYNQDKEIDYTMEDLLEEMQSNGEKGIKTVETTILIHKDLLDNEENKQKAIELIETLSDKLNQLTKLIKE